ncbi:cytochrome P450 7A1 [Chanos chanos]|uniref:Cytochrome P450 7A1 n=1 Tax=Chanos chanos TaxID=29144 RepID=A0A6J2VV55_CHACN|nr:cytochrome P450 7A1-like [Chanos chanos]
MASLLVGILTVLLSLFLVWQYGKTRKRKPGEPPLETGWMPFIGLALDYGRNPLGFLQDMQRKHGNVFTCKIAGKYLTFITDPFSFSSVVRQGKNLDFQKFAMGFSQRVFGHADFNSPMLSESYKEVHSIFRQTLQGPPLQQLTQSMLGNLQTVLSQDSQRGHGWQEEGLQSFTNRIMFEAGFLTLFGQEAELPKLRGVAKAGSFIRKTVRDFLMFDKAFPALAAGVPISLCLSAWRAREALASELKHSGLQRRNCISALIQRRMDAFDRMRLDETGKARTHVCMLWASQANTLPAAFWSLYYTLRSPAALDAALSEINRVLQESEEPLDDPSQLISLTREQLESMTVLDSIIAEALRLSSASIMIRVANEDFVLTLDSGEQVAIRKGDYICLYPQLIHMDPEVYPNPTEFQFDRYLEADGKKKSSFFKAGRRLRHFLIPFGSGASECPGRFFAVNEIKEFLTLALWHYDLELSNPDATLAPDCARAGLGILPPSRDVLLRYRVRERGGTPCRHKEEKREE